MKASMTKQELIFSMLEHPVTNMGGITAVLSNDGKIKGVHFGGGLSAASFGSMSTPWQRVWAHSWILEHVQKLQYKTIESNWIYLNKATGKCQVFDRRNFPSTSDERVIKECGDYAILGGNGVSGFSFFRIDDNSLTLLNNEPIPYFIWTSWVEEDYVMLAGMTQRTLMAKQRPDEEENYARGRPALIRCMLGTGQWEEVSFMDPQGQGVDLVRDWPDAFVPGPFIHNVVTKAESWVGSEFTPDGDRIILAGMGEQSMPFEDPQFTDTAQPMDGDYYSLALVSYREQRILCVLPGHTFVRALYAPGKTLFIVQIDDGQELRWAGRGNISQLHVIDPLGKTAEVTKMQFEGLPPDLPFLSRFDASYFNECGFFGSIKTLEDKYYFVQSHDGIYWKCLGDSEQVEVTNAAAFL